MPYIGTVSAERAPAELRELHLEILQATGLTEIPNLFQCASLDTDISRWIWQASKTVMRRESAIPRRLKELIALVVSETNSCQYCVDRHSSVLKTLGFDEQRITALRDDRANAGLAEAEKAALNYAVKVTTHPHKVTEADPALLREVGYTDRQILEIATVTALFNFVNRFVLALS